jgi:hypothetical protein
MSPIPGGAFTLPFPSFLLALVLAILLAPVICAAAPFLDLGRCEGEGTAS